MCIELRAQCVIGIKGLVLKQASKQAVNQTNLNSFFFLKYKFISGSKISLRATKNHSKFE